MKAITLWQPWASLLACGAKQYETRSWATSYRGPIAIHAAARKCNTKDLCASTVYTIIQTIRPLVADKAKTTMYLPLEMLPFGTIIATAELINCWHIVHHPGTDVDVAKHIKVGAELDVPKKHPDFHRYIVPTEQELLFGDWTPGCYAWEFANMTMLPEPIPAKGRQGLWNWEEGEMYHGEQGEVL